MGKLGRFSLQQLFAVCLLLSAQLGQAYFGPERPIHHQFNARLLQAGETKYTLSLFRAEGAIGLTPTLEVGANALVLVAGGAHLSLKHEMFRFDGVQTSFQVQAFYIGRDATRGLVAPMGVVSTIESGLRDLQYNVGIYDVLLYTDRKGKIGVSGSEFRVEGHVFAPLFGVDYLLSSSWAFTAAAVVPVYGMLDSDSDEGEVSLALPIFRSDDPLKVGNTAFYFAGFQNEFETFSIEYGIWGFGSAVYPMLNLAWRMP